MTKQPFYEAELPFIRKWVRGAVLDVGSNVGRFSRLSPATTSIDIDPRWLRRGIDLGNIREAVLASAFALPFKREAFDTVLALGVIEHIPLRLVPRFLDDLTRVTKPMGTLVIQTPSPYALFSLRRIRLWSEYLHPYSPFRLRKELRVRGWHHVTWISSGLVGLIPVVSGTANGLVPWAVGVTQVLVRS